MDTTVHATYRAVHARFGQPSHVQRISTDEQGRRTTQIIATCDSTNLDNDLMVDFIVRGLRLLRILDEKLDVLEESGRLISELNSIMGS